MKTEKLKVMSIHNLWKLRVKILRARIRERDFDRNQGLIAMSDQVTEEIERRVGHGTDQRGLLNKADRKDHAPAVS